MNSLENFPACLHSVPGQCTHGCRNIFTPWWLGRGRVNTLQGMKEAQFTDNFANNAASFSDASGDGMKILEREREVVAMEGNI